VSLKKQVGGSRLGGRSRDEARAPHMSANALIVLFISKR
jgi:hypothetical protein